MSTLLSEALTSYKAFSSQKKISIEVHCTFFQLFFLCFSCLVFELPSICPQAMNTNFVSLHSTKAENQSHHLFLRLSWQRLGSSSQKSIVMSLLPRKLFILDKPSGTEKDSKSVFLRIPDSIFFSPGLKQKLLLSQHPL